MKLMNDSPIENIKSEFELIYRASRDGWNSKDFHRKCYNKKRTVSLIQTDTNNVFGGYVTIPWKGRGGSKRDPTAFLILIRSSKNYKPDRFTYHKGTAMYDSNTYMCIYGGGNDIKIFSNCNKYGGNYTCQYSFNTPSNLYLNGDDRSFTVKEIEVFCV